MKKYVVEKISLFTFLFIVAVSISLALPLSANERTMSLSWEPLSLFIGTVSGEYAVKIQDRIALAIPFTLEFININSLVHSLYQAERLSFTNGFRGELGLGAKFFLSNSAFNSSWIIQPIVSLGYNKFVVQGESKWEVVSKGLVGYGWYLDSGFMISLLAGIQYLPNASVLKLRPAFDFSLGYSW